MASDRLTNLDILRGLAALAVCLYHFNQPGFLAMPWVEGVFSHGERGVDVFFVISGFVIPLALARGAFSLAEKKTFLIGRFLRLYPAYVLAGAVSVGLWYLSSLLPGFRGESPSISGRQVLGNLLMICDFIKEDWFIPVFWTLAIEAQYYIVILISYPFLVGASRAARVSTLIVWVGAPWLAGGGVTVFGWTALFAMGVIGFLWQRGYLSNEEALWFLVSAFVVHGWVAGWVSSLVGVVTLLVILFLPPLNGRWFIQLGLISYSLYLLHVPVGARVVNLAQRLELPFLAPPLVVILALVLSIGASVFFFRWVERPSHSWARSLRARAYQRPPSA